MILPPGTYTFLILLAAGTVLLPVISFPFMRVLPPHTLHHVPQPERQALHRTRPSGSRIPHHGSPEIPHQVPKYSLEDPNDEVVPEAFGGENSSLISKSTIDDAEDLESSKHSHTDRNHEPPHLDIRGFALLPHAEFWQLFSMLGILTGIGLMTIK